MEEIKNQLVFLLGSFLSGIFVMLAYEAVNVFRGLFRPGVFGKLVVDVLFFVISGICVFRMIFLCNNGTIRSFFVFAFGAGALLYRKTAGTLLSDLIVKIVRKIWHLVTRPAALLAGKVRARRKRKKDQKAIKEKEKAERQKNESPENQKPKSKTKKTKKAQKEKTKTPKNKKSKKKT